VLKIVENLSAVGAMPRTPLGEFTALPDPLAGGKGVAAVVTVRGLSSLLKFEPPAIV